MSTILKLASLLKLEKPYWATENKFNSETGYYESWEVDMYEDGTFSRSLSCVQWPDISLNISSLISITEKLLIKNFYVSYSLRKIRPNFFMVYIEIESTNQALLRASGQSSENFEEAFLDAIIHLLQNLEIYSSFLDEKEPILFDNEEKFADTVFTDCTREIAESSSN